AEMQRLLDETRPRAIAARSPEEFGAIVNGMIRLFKDSHFEFFTNDEQGYYLMQNLLNQSHMESMPELGAWFKSTPRGETVQMVLDSEEAAKAGLRKGDVIMTFEGAPFSPVDSLRSKIGNQVSI